MLRTTEALRFRCLEYTKAPLGRFNVLVGPNASGKTSFLDIISFIKDTVSQGVEYAIRSRTDNVYDLFWQRKGRSFDLALDAAIPLSLQEQLPPPQYNTVRYEIKIGFNSTDSDAEVGILGERVSLLHFEDVIPSERSLFPQHSMPPRTIYDPGRRPTTKTVVHKVPGKNDNYYSEMSESKGKGWLPSFKFGSQKSALGNLPDDGTRFPVCTWLREFLTRDVQSLVLNSLVIRKPSPPGQPSHFKPDGSNLPWAIHRLQSENPLLFSDWIEHVRTALPDVVTVTTKEREEDRHRYLVVTYTNGIDVPSWMVSDGTLRLFALTLLAYLDDFNGLYLIEEPENGIHPRAVEPVFQSLSSLYNAQVIIATHSPVILGLVDIRDVLCFATSDGATDIVPGDQHPSLRDWRGESSLGVLFASGILG